MPNSKELAQERSRELKKLGKLSFWLVVAGSLIFLLQKVPAPVNMPLDHTIFDTITFGLQSIIGHQDVKKLFMLVLLLFTAFVAMETLVLLRLYAACLYAKYKNNNAVD